MSDSTIRMTPIDSAAVENPPAGKLKIFLGLDGVLRSKNSSGVVTAYATGISPEEVQDIVGAFIQNSTQVIANYDDNANALTFTIVQNQISHSAIANLGADDHAQYLTNARGDVRYYLKAFIDSTFAKIADYVSNTTLASTLLNYIGTSEKGNANGVATLDAAVKIPLVQIPNGIDHTGLANRGTNTHAQIDSHLASVLNPHGTTKAQVGLEFAENTSDLNKPISTATQNALNNKSDSNHIHADATQADSGFMSALDKTKLDNIISGILPFLQNNVINTSNVTFQTLTDLQIPVVAGKRYKFEAYILFSSLATGTGIGLSIGGTATGILRSIAEAPVTNTPGTGNKFSGPISALNSVVTTTGVGAANTQYRAQIEGVFTALTSGFIYPQFRSETNGTAITVYADSNLEYKEY